MKNSGFRRLTYEEIIAKQQKRQEKKNAKPKSQAARMWKKRSNKKKTDNDKRELEWKRSVRERDLFECQYPGCNIKDRSIHCHHINPRSQRKDLIHVVSNGICLCWKHHEEVHQHPLEAVELGLLSKETREKFDKEVLPYPGEE